MLPVLLRIAHDREGLRSRRPTTPIVPARENWPGRERVIGGNVPITDTSNWRTCLRNTLEADSSNPTRSADLGVAAAECNQERAQSKLARGQNTIAWRSAPSPATTFPPTIV